MQVLVRDNNVDQALKALKKKMQREGIFREMKLRGHYEKPSEKKAREKAEAIRRARKLARKRAQREGLLPGKPKPVMGAAGGRPVVRAVRAVHVPAGLAVAAVVAAGSAAARARRTISVFGAARGPLRAVSFFAFCWSMIFSENRCPLFGIML